MYLAKTTVIGVSVSVDFVILACVILTQYEHVTDRLWDRRTCWPWLFIVLCIAIQCWHTV